MSISHEISDVDGVTVIDDDLPAFKGDALLVELESAVQVIGEDDGVTTQYFVVSGVETPFSGWECIAFAAQDDGTPINFRDHAGGEDASHEDVLAQLVALAEGDHD